jgi:hypothetical protein
MPDTHARASNGQLACIVLIPTSIAILCCFIDQLIKGREDVVCELDLKEKKGQEKERGVRERVISCECERGVLTSAIAVWPIAATPMPNPMIPCSVNGVLKTLSLPNSSLNPMVERNTPPKATSSPKTKVDSSVAKACD